MHIVALGQQSTALERKRYVRPNYMYCLTPFAPRCELYIARDIIATTWLLGGATRTRKALPTLRQL